MSYVPRFKELAQHERHKNVAETRYWCDQYKLLSRLLEETLDVAQARIAELEVVARKVMHCDHCGDNWYDSGIARASCPHCRIAFLKATGKELEEDAHRYRWLRQQTGDETGKWNRSGTVLWYGDELDAAIDAARAKEGK